MSSIGRRRGGINKGYTLIELILTAVIILVIVGLSAPVFKRSFSELKVNLNARDMAAVMNLAREKAILTRAQHAIIVEPDLKTYRIAGIDAEKNKFAPIEGRWGRKFFISDNLKVSADSEVIKFFADGSSSGAKIIFEDQAGIKSRVIVGEKSGQISVDRGGDEKPKQE